MRTTVVAMEIGLGMNTDARSQTVPLKDRYTESGYVIANDIFPATSLQALSDSFRLILEKTTPEMKNRSCTLDDLILRCEKEDHKIVYDASQSGGSSATAYQPLGSSGIFDLITEITGFDKGELHVMPMYLIVQLPSDERFDYVWHQDGSYIPGAMNC